MIIESITMKYKANSIPKKLTILFTEIENEEGELFDNSLHDK